MAIAVATSFFMLYNIIVRCFFHFSLKILLFRWFVIATFFYYDIIYLCILVHCKILLIYAEKRDIAIYLFSFYDIINTGRYCKLSIFFLLYLHNNNNNKSFAFSSIYSFLCQKEKMHLCISSHKRNKRTI